MTTRTDITVDWLASPRIITVASPSTELTIQDLVDTLRVAEFDRRGLSEPKLVDAAGKEPLGGGVFVGITCSLLNALVAFEARSGPGFEQCNVSGGNLVAFDDLGAVQNSPIQTTAYTQVTLTSSSSATLQEQADIEYSSFSGGVTVDQVNGEVGTAFPLGTPRAPVNNLDDAVLIATERGFVKIFIRGNLVFADTDNVVGYVFEGQSINLTDITLTPAATIQNCEFTFATVSGTLDGGTTLRDCSVGPLSFVDGLIEDCALESGTITLSGVDTANFIDCHSAVPGGGAGDTPVINMGGTGSALVVRNYSGGLKLENFSGTDKVSMDYESGRLILDSTISNGTIVVRGVLTVEDNSTGTTVVDQTGVLNPQKVLTVSKFLALQ